MAKRMCQKLTYLQHNEKRINNKPARVQSPLTMAGRHGIAAFESVRERLGIGICKLRQHAFQCTEHTNQMER